MTDTEKREALAAQNLSRVELLIALPEMQWFLEQCVMAKREEADRSLHDLKRTTEQRDNDLHRWTSLNDVLGWLTEQRTMYRQVLGNKNV